MNSALLCALAMAGLFLSRNTCAIQINTVSALKNKLIRESNQAWLRSATLTPSEQSSILSLASELEGKCEISMPMEHLSLLDGKWRTLYSTLPIKSMSSVASLTYNGLPSPQNPENNLSVEVLDVFQVVDSSRRAYDNYVEFVTKTQEPQLKGVIATIGTFAGDSDENRRLQIEFQESYVRSVDMNKGFEQTPLSDLRPFKECAQLREAMKLNRDQSLFKEMKYKGYSDVTYIDTSGDLRIMRGAAGGMYILERVM